MTKNITSSARQAALLRRKALSASGKAAMSTTEKTRSAASKDIKNVNEDAVTRSVVANQAASGSARKASLERRIAMSRSGKKALGNADRTREDSISASGSNSKPDESGIKECKKDTSCDCGCKDKDNLSASGTDSAQSMNQLSMSVSAELQQNLTRKKLMSSARAATLSRRKAMSTKGKAALQGGTVSEASAARAANPNITSRELAQALRNQRSVKGKTGKKDSTTPTGPARRRPRNENSAAEDASWKVGASDTASGQTVTGTMVDRMESITGNEASTCRSVTGTEYMGADVFKQFCQSEPQQGFNRVGVTSTAAGNSVSGNELGRSGRVTGDEPGSCKNVTGTEYLSADHSKKFCGTVAEKRPVKTWQTETLEGKKVTGKHVERSSKMTGDEVGSNRLLTGTQYMKPVDDVENVPHKVGTNRTLRGSTVSGGEMGRSKHITGNEIGGCKYVTGDDYVSQDEYTEFCDTKPAPVDQKIGVSNTLKGKAVTGTMTGRANHVTGDEPGTCQSVTGTPYAGREQYSEYCNNDKTAMAMARSQKSMSGATEMSGIQPAVAGKVSGDRKGACEQVSGTPYVGQAQQAAVCNADAATQASPDFPQMMQQAPWQGFSVAEPSGVTEVKQTTDRVTGAYKGSGRITGPFGMASGVITGTDDARLDRNKNVDDARQVSAAVNVQANQSRVTGEGTDAGKKITGDDWDRGDHVTGTEGMSATRRNPTRRGGVDAMSQPEWKRNEEIVIPPSKVTGSSGNTEKGSLITYSGGARG